MIKEMICISCPMGCHLSCDITDMNDIKVTGNTCPRGVLYAKDELTQPKRIVTGSMRVIGGNKAMLSVKTSNAIDKHLIFDSLRLLNEITVNAPIHIGDVMIENVLGTGVNFVATKEIL